MQLKTIRATDGETVKVTNQWAAETEKRGTTVSTSVWETTAGSLSGESLVTPLATVLLTVTGSGDVTNTVTLANGEVLVAARKIAVD